jgi:hypothetical protein
MRRIITALLVLLTTSAIAQNGGQITGKKNSGLTGTVMVDSVALKVSDSASRVYLSAMKLKSDSIYKRMYQDSVNLAKLGTGVTITGSVTANLDVTDSTNLSGINSKLAGTLTVSLPTGASTETTLSSLNSKVPSGLSTAGNRLAIYSPDSIKVFATNGFGSGGSGGTTSLDAVDSTNLANTATNTSRLPSGLTVTSTRLLVDGSGVTQPVSLSGNVNTTISGVVKKTLGTQVVSADTGLVVNAVMHGLSTGGGGGYFDVKVNPSGALTVDATQSGTWNVNNVSGTVSLPTGASTESTSSAIYAEILDQSSNYLSPSKLKLDSIYTRLGTGVTVNSHPVTFTRLKASTDTVAISGTITATAGATTIYDSTRSATSMTVTNLNSLASSATVGWQSDSVRNNVRKAVDYKINVKLTMANTAPANDKAVYVYICPFYFDGTNWYAASQGTTTLPTGAQGASTIASPNNLRLLGVLSYTTQNQVCQDNFLLSNAFGNVMPDGFSIIIVNFSGAAVSASGNVVNYSPINKVQR